MAKLNKFELAWKGRSLISWNIQELPTVFAILSGGHLLFTVTFCCTLVGRKREIAL